MKAKVRQISAPLDLWEVTYEGISPEYLQLLLDRVQDGALCSYLIVNDAGATVFHSVRLTGLDYNIGTWSTSVRVTYEFPKP